MKSDEPNSDERMRRMRKMFSEDLTILAEDYEHFTGINPQDVPTGRSTNSRKSEESSEPPNPGQN